jgi:hypothetical protein
MRCLIVGAWVLLAAVPAWGQHAAGVSGSGISGRGASAGFARGSARGTMQRPSQPYGVGRQFRAYGSGTRAYGNHLAPFGGAGRGGMLAPGRDRDGDGDRDGRGREYGWGYGRGGRFGDGGRNRGVPYVNPYGYGYGYPLVYSGLTYAGDLGFGDDGYNNGSNEDDADNGSGDDSGQGDDQAPVPYSQGDPQDEGPAGYVGPYGSSGNSGYGYGYGAMPPAGSGYGANYGSGVEAPSGYRYGGAHSTRSLSNASSRTMASPDAGDASADASTAVTLVFKDGRPPETIHNYALTRTTLYVTDAKPQEIPVDDLNLPATEKVNREAGVKFQLPN